jgi:serine/threonine protein kinase
VGIFVEKLVARLDRLLEGRHMPAASTSDDFLALVHKSGLLSEEQLDAYPRRALDGDATDEPKGLARAMVRDGVLTHFQAEQLLQGRSKGFVLAKYLILERLGATRMSTVFLCHHQAMNRVVCVKVLTNDRAAKSSMLQRFYREARAAASLCHPNIVRAHDVEETDRGHLLVMEYIHGPSLGKLVADHGPLSPLRAAHCIYQAALGLQFAHEKGLVHRDVKPGNFVIDRAGTVKVLDLGLALLTNDDQTQLTHGLIGSVDYLAPEQGVDSHAVDARADVYGLGATFYFLLTGAPPFRGTSIAQRVLAHRSEQLRPIHSIRPEVPAELDAIIARMMAKEPDDRYPSAAAVAEALLPFLQQPVDPPSEAEMPRLSRAARKAISPEGSSNHGVSKAGIALARPSVQCAAESRQSLSQDTLPLAVSSSTSLKETADAVLPGRHDSDSDMIMTGRPADWQYWWLIAAAILAGLLWYRVM